MTTMARRARPDNGLTPRQRHILQVIEDAVRTRGYSPTLREIAGATGLASASSVARHLSILQDRGFLDRAAGRPRTAVIRLPDDPAPAAPAGPPGRPAPSQPGTVAVPVMGRAAAGPPILAEQRPEDFFALPAQLVGQGEFFMLKVAGDSMMNAAIVDGDWVVVRRNTDIENGDIVAAMFDDLEPEATIKTFKRVDGHVWLIPHNPVHQPIAGDEATIMGKVVAVLRRV